MDWLNYHHLYYFWLVAREGSLARAAEQAHLASPTISKQLGQLEKALGGNLFQRTGRKLELTEFGQFVFSYADDIFTAGRELQQAIRVAQPERPGRLVVGVLDVLPKLVVHRILKPALGHADPAHVQCREGRHDELLAELTAHRIDLVLSDAPSSPAANVRAYNHLLGECGVTFFATKALAAKHRRSFPRSLDNAPLLLPMSRTAARRELDHWFATQSMRINIIAEFEDSALMKVFGHDGLGIFPAPSVIEDDVCRQYAVNVVGRLEDVRERFYAISVERRAQHPAVAAICSRNRGDIWR